MFAKVKSSHGLALLGFSAILSLILIGNALNDNSDFLPLVFSPRLQLAQVASYNSGLVLNYTFDDGSGTSAGDSGGTNAGTLFNSPVWSTDKKVGTNSLQFDGVDDYVQSATVNGSGYSSFSYGFWFKTGNASGNVILSWGTTACKMGGVGSGKLNCYVDLSSSGSASTATTVNDNQWHHIVFVHTPSGQTIYLDGVQSGTATETLGSINSVVRVGKDQGGSTGYLAGSVDDVRIYGRALTSSEVSGLYGNTTSLPISNTPVVPSDPPPSTGGDTTPPSRSSGSPSGVLSAGQTTATISLATNENATCKYGTTAGTTYASLSSAFGTTGSTNHSSTVSGLSVGSYSYYIRCQDTIGNANVDDFTISFSIPSPITGTIPTNGLIAHYKFDDGSGSILADSSGRGNNGTLVDSPAWVSGRLGGALSFDGTKTYVTIPYKSDFDFTNAGSGAFTVTAWIKPKNFINEVTHKAIVQDITGGSSAKGWAMYYEPTHLNNPGTILLDSSSGHLHGDYTDSAARYGSIAGGTEIQSNTGWYHVAFTYSSSGGGGKIYVNSVLEISDTGGAGITLDTTKPITIGGQPYSIPSSIFNGLIDEVQIYNRALSQAEIQSIMAVGNAGVSDYSAPTIRITSPTNATKVTGTVNISASASDNVGVAGVQFKINTADVGPILTSAPYSYSWNTSSIPAGYYTLAAKAWDSYGNTSVTPWVLVSKEAAAGSTPTPVNGVYTVKQDGSGSFTTIKACADIVKPGETCLVYAGNYSERVAVKRGGTSENSRVIFKAQGQATLTGFDISAPYVTVDGFDITGTAPYAYSGYITVIRGGDNCSIINNSIHDGMSKEYGIFFGLNGGVAANNCVVRNNTLNRLNYQYISTNGANHLVEGNTLLNLDGWDAFRIFGNDIIVRRNVVKFGLPRTGIGNHPDFVQTFPDNGDKAYNVLFEENWVENLDTQIGQINSGVASTGLSPNIHDFVFKKNVFTTLSSNMNIVMPGVVFDHNTFHKISYLQSGLVFSSSLTRGDFSRARLTSNTFIDGGQQPDTYGARGYYSNGGAAYSIEAINTFVANNTISTAIYNELRNNQFVGVNGEMTAKTKSLTDVSQLTLSSAYSQYKTQVFNSLVKVNQLNDSVNSTFFADYNMISGGPSDGYAAKRKFTEPHGINGGNPMFTDPSNPMGPDGIPFTTDDGLKPKPGSPLCGKGENGTDIGAYSCDPGTVFAIQGSGYVFVPPTVTPPVNNTPVNGICSNSVNVCSAGTFSDLTDTTTNNLWSCLGSNGGTTASCSTPKSIVDTTPPTISAISTSGITTTGATISFITNEPATTQIEYGLTTTYGSNTTLVSTLVTSHTQSISNLANTTVYHYRIHSKDSSGNEAISPDQTFTTLKPVVVLTPDVTLPVVTLTEPIGGTVQGNVLLSATALDPTSPSGQTTSGLLSVQFKIDNFNLGTELTTAPFSGSWNTTGASNGSHTITAIAKDIAGNTKVSNNITVTVSNPIQVADTTVPSRPTNLVASAVSQSQINLSWTASSDNTAVTMYKIYRDLVQVGTSVGTSYSDSGLTAATHYSYSVTALDAVLNESLKAVSVSITTNPAPVVPVPVPPVLSNGAPNRSFVYGTTKATLSLNTDKPATCRYATTPNTGFRLMRSNFETTGGTTHSTLVTDITDGVSYTYYVRCEDAGGNMNTADYIISLAVNSFIGNPYTIPFQNPVNTGVSNTNPTPTSKPITVTSTPNKVPPSIGTFTPTVKQRTVAAVKAQIASKPVNTNSTNSLITNNTTNSEATSSIDITVPKIPSWFDIVRSIIVEIAAQIKRGVVRTVDVVKEMF